MNPPNTSEQRFQEYLNLIETEDYWKAFSNREMEIGKIFLKLGFNQGEAHYLPQIEKLQEELALFGRTNVSLFNRNSELQQQLDQLKAAVCVKDEAIKALVHEVEHTYAWQEMEEAPLLEAKAALSSNGSSLLAELEQLKANAWKLAQQAVRVLVMDCGFDGETRPNDRQDPIYRQCLWWDIERILSKEKMKEAVKGMKEASEEHNRATASIAKREADALSASEGKKEAGK